MLLIRGLPGRWDGLIVLCAVNAFDGVKMGDRHLADHLSKLAPVLYVDPPLSPLTPLRKSATFRRLPGAQRRVAPPPVPAVATVAGPRLRLAAPGLARLTPVVQPFPSRPGSAALTSAITRRYLREATSRLGRVRAVISGWPQYPVFGSCNEQVRVYWAKDDFVSGASLFGLHAGMLEARERRVAGAAHLVVAASPVVAGTWRDRGLDPVLIPFGTDVDAYASVDQAPVPADVDLPGPVAGFIGHINHRTDLRLLEAVAARGRSLLLVGPYDPAFEPRRFAGLCRRPNVCWTGPKPFRALPGYLRVIDVGLVPYAATGFNRASFPLKMLEYLAAGRAVVTTDLPAARWLATDLIVVVPGPGEFADAVDRMLAQPRTAAVAARRRAFAARHSWSARAADIYDAISARQSAPAGR